MKAISIVSAIALAAWAFPAAAAAPAHLSWGKAGVAFERYRADAVECGVQAHYTDVSGTEAARVLKQASRQLESNEASVSMANTPEEIVQSEGNSARIVEAARPEARIGEVRQFLYRNLDDCLLARGYTPFRLSREQERKLHSLRAGSPERHAFLYRLATDPKVLSTQAVELPGAPAGGDSGKRSSP
jgi:hypothetical protein